LSRPRLRLNEDAHLSSPKIITGADKVFRLDRYSNSIHSPSRPRAKRNTHEDPAE